MTRFFVAAFAVFFGANASLAADQILTPKAATTALRNSIGGSQIAVLYPNAKLKFMEEQEDWYKVEMTGWVHRDDLKATSGGPNASNVVVGERSPIVVEDFEISELSKLETREKARVKLVLKLRNRSTEAVPPWGGVLSIEHSGGAIISRFAVTGPKETVAAGGAQEATFSWSEEQKEYGLLKGRTKSELRVILSAVKAE